MNNEIAGLSSPSIPILIIRLFTQPGINNLFCVGGTALRCKGGEAMSSISKNTRRSYQTWMRGMKNSRQR
jgi:hypothetical protein